MAVTFSEGSTITFPAPAAGARMIFIDADGDGDMDILYQTGANVEGVNIGRETVIGCAAEDQTCQLPGVDPLLFGQQLLRP